MNTQNTQRQKVGELKNLRELVVDISWWGDETKMGYMALVADCDCYGPGWYHS
jgi:hypothetical protein